MTVCGLCGHEMVLERCGYAAVGDVPLCHADDHSCYHAWTVNRTRPGDPWPAFGCGEDPRC